MGIGRRNAKSAEQHDSIDPSCDPQAVGDVNGGPANVAGLRAAVPGAGRLHKRLAVVRRGVPLPVRVRRGPDALLRAAAAAAAAAGPGRPRDPHRPRRRLLHRPAGLPAARPPLDIPAPPEEHLLRDGDNRRQGSDMLTQRQFCALRRGRPGHHCVTIAVVHLAVGPGVPPRVSGQTQLGPALLKEPRGTAGPRNAQNCREIRDVRWEGSSVIGERVRRSMTRASWRTPLLLLFFSFFFFERTLSFPVRGEGGRGGSRFKFRE